MPKEMSNSREELFFVGVHRQVWISEEPRGKRTLNIGRAELDTTMRLEGGKRKTQKANTANTEV